MKNKIIMLRVLKELKGKMLFCFIVEESDRFDIVLEKKVRVGVVIIMNFYNGYLI